MKRRTTRRDFVKVTAAASAGFWAAGGVTPRPSRAAIEEVSFGCIGVGGKGSSDSAEASRHGNIVAICDIDDRTLAKAKKLRPKAEAFHDWRKMLDKMGKTIDAVTVSTPDHSHAPATATAIKMGIACYTQKPMTHAIYEARRLGELAREYKVATQMGNQYTAHAGLREASAAIKAGVLGKVEELHVWTNRPVWPQGADRPTEKPQTPSHIHWDLFIGPAPMRPYHPAYHPFKWRGWWDFGTGALGDMACHTLNMPFASLDLKNPISVQAKSSGHNGETYPSWSMIDYEFLATEIRPAVKMRWYDGQKLPPKELFGGHKVQSSGSLLIGEKGSLYAPGDYAQKGLNWIGIDKPKVEFKRSPGHFVEYVNAIKGGEPAMSNFPDYATPLTETVLLGNLAVWADGKKVIWDAEKCTSSNMPELESIVRPTYRKGYEL